MMFDQTTIESGVATMLEGLGLEGEEYKLTPERVARALMELCSGLLADIDDVVFKDGIFEVEQEARRVPTTFTNISARGLCAHHLMPVIYKAEVKYKPRKKVVGLSRIHRLVRILAARPVLQEQLVYDIAKVLRDKLECPVSVRLEGRHMCMIARGSRTELDAPVICELELE